MNFRSCTVLRVLLSLPVVGLLFSSVCAWGIETQPIIVVFRYDDYSAKSPTEFERKLFASFQRVRACVSVGVIPFVCESDSHDPKPQKLLPLPEEKIELLKKATREGHVEVALHGYSHQTLSAIRHAEFEGHSYQELLRRIMEGKQSLEQSVGERVQVFIPPWNRYNLETVRALEVAGLSIISASTTQGAPRETSLRFLPATCNLESLRRTIEAARENGEQSIIVVLFHPYDFREIDRTRGFLTYDDFQTLLQWVANQKDVRLLSLANAATIIDDLSPERLNANRILYWVRWMLPKVFCSQKIEGRFLSTAEAWSQAIQIVALSIMVLVFFASVSLATTYVGLTYSKRFGKIRSFLAILLIVIGAGLSAWILRGLKITSLAGLVAVALGLGAVFGSIVMQITDWWRGCHQTVRESEK